MEISYPALTTGALFTALILLDFGKHQFKLLIGHFLVGIIAVLLMIYLSQNGADMAAWGIFSIPIVMLCIGLIIGALRSVPGAVTVVATNAIKATSSAGPVPCDESGNPLSFLSTGAATPIAGAATPVAGAATPVAGAAAPVTGAAATVPCGPGSGNTQCIDTTKLTSA